MLPNVPSGTIIDEDAPEHHVDEVQADPRHHDRGDQTDDDQGGPDQQAEHEDVPPTAVPDERGRARAGKNLVISQIGIAIIASTTTRNQPIAAAMK